VSRGAYLSLAPLVDAEKLGENGQEHSRRVGAHPLDLLSVRDVSDGRPSRLKGTYVKVTYLCAVVKNRIAISSFAKRTRSTRARRGETRGRRRRGER
jgi:hypothetical protein